MMGGAQSFGFTVEEAQAMGASPQEQAIAAVSNAALGAGTEAVSGAYFLNRLNKATGGKLWETLKKIPLDTGPGPIKSAILGFVAESSQETIQTLGENVVAADIAGYDPDRPTGQNVKEAWTIGGIVGALFGGGTGELARRERVKQEEELQRIRDEVHAGFDPINDIGSSTAPFTPLGERGEMSADMVRLEEFIQQRSLEAETRQLLGTEAVLPPDFVLPSEAT